MPMNHGCPVRILTQLQCISCSFLRLWGLLLCFCSSKSYTILMSLMHWDCLIASWFSSAVIFWCIQQCLSGVDFVILVTHGMRIRILLGALKIFWKQASGFLQGIMTVSLIRKMESQEQTPFPVFKCWALRTDKYSIRTAIIAIKHHFPEEISLLNSTGYKNLY